MNNDEIEIFDDFSTPNPSNVKNESVNVNQTLFEDLNNPTSQPVFENQTSEVKDINNNIQPPINQHSFIKSPYENEVNQQNSSVNEFEQMMETVPIVSDEPVKQQEYIPPVQTFENQNPVPFMETNVENDNFNNNLVSNNYDDDQNDLTITAVYPNGFAVEQNDELENTQVIKPQKSKNIVDIILFVIVGLLAVGLVVLLVLMPNL